MSRMYWKYSWLQLCIIHLVSQFSILQQAFRKTTPPDEQDKYANVPKTKNMFLMYSWKHISANLCKQKNVYKVAKWSALVHNIDKPTSCSFAVWWFYLYFIFSFTSDLTGNASYYFWRNPHWKNNNFLMTNSVFFQTYVSVKVSERPNNFVTLK